MSSSFPLLFQPTFTQGLIIGQLTILILLGMILKYLFLESSQYPFKAAAYHQQVDSDAYLRQRDFQARKSIPQHDPDTLESTEWFNLLFRQVGSLRTHDSSQVLLFIHSHRFSTSTDPNLGMIQRVLKGTRLRENESRHTPTLFGQLASWYVLCRLLEILSRWLNSSNSGSYHCPLGKSRTFCAMSF